LIQSIDFSIYTVAVVPIPADTPDARACACITSNQNTFARKATQVEFAEIVQEKKFETASDTHLISICVVEIALPTV
jgi:hypothetical protein